MMTCDRVREWLPWYLTGSIDFQTAEEIADHLRTCAACRAEFVEVARLRHRFAAAVDAAPTPRASVWARLSRRLGPEETLRVDLGSFLVGLRVGIAAHDRRTPVRGDLRIGKRHMRILGGKKGA